MKIRSVKKAAEGAPVDCVSSINEALCLVFSAAN